MLQDGTKRLLREGGFNLWKFRTNCPSLQVSVDAEEGVERLPDESYADAMLGVSQAAGPQETKILGVRWNSQTDCLIFSVSDIAQEAQIVEPTKRNVVSVVGRIYDPLGLLVPLVQAALSEALHEYARLGSSTDQSVP